MTQDTKKIGKAIYLFQFERSFGKVTFIAETSDKNFKFCQISGCVCVIRKKYKKSSECPYCSEGEGLKMALFPSQF